MSRPTPVKRLALAALFLALGLVLPFLTGQLRQFGNMLLPMHLPVLLCGLLCGWQWGGVVGFLLPLLRHALFSMPPMPQGVAMAFELAAYGLIIGLCYQFSRRKSVPAVYRALLAAMVGGRLVWAAVRVIMTGVAQVPFTWQLFLSQAFLTAIPGIILQLLLVPALMAALNKAGFVSFGESVPS